MPILKNLLYRFLKELMFVLLALKALSSVKLVVDIYLLIDI